MFNVSSVSEVGGHPHNEDAFLVIERQGVLICLVADGQGGQHNGGPAAQLACRVAGEVVANPGTEWFSDVRFWVSLVRTVDRAVESDKNAGLTTFAGCCVTGNRVIGSSSGDSAILAVMESQTIELTAAQRKNPPAGSGMAIGIPFEATLTLPWQLLAMTDGVWKYVGWQRVA